MARIATLYSSFFSAPFAPCTMDEVRWLRISKAFACRGHEVDLVINSEGINYPLADNLRYVSSAGIDWDRYDMIKTLFHEGFDYLAALGGTEHPLIISKLGSVVGKDDGVKGVFFYDEMRQQLYETQEKISRHSKYVTTLTRESATLWSEVHEGTAEVLVVPTGVDSVLPDPGDNPYAQYEEKIAVYIGNLYVAHSGQRSVNVLWQKRLSSIGRLLRKRGIRLIVIGPGDVDLLDFEAVTYLGKVSNSEIYNYMHHADVGLVFAQGDNQHNESSKIYDYLRSGLPVVSEIPVPNSHMINEANLGYLAEYRNDARFVELVMVAANSSWDRSSAIDYMLQNHTWDQRVLQYEKVLGWD